MEDPKILTKFVKQYEAKILCGRNCKKKIVRLNFDGRILCSENFVRQKFCAAKIVRILCGKIRILCGKIRILCGKIRILCGKIENFVRQNFVWQN